MASSAKHSIRDLLGYMRPVFKKISQAFCTLAFGTTATFFSVLIDDILIYPLALNAEEIQGLVR